MQAIERIRTALQKHAAAKTLAEAWILADENEDALSVESLTEVLAHIDQLRAEIHASDLAVAEYRQQCIDNAQEIARLRAESEERLQNCVALAAENERLRAAPATAPAWHDAPTCAGLWLCDESDKNPYRFTCHDISMPLNPHLAGEGERWYGPISGDK